MIHNYMIGDENVAILHNYMVGNYNADATELYDWGIAMWICYTTT